MELGLDGRVALVTGSSKGLGRASALALGQEGAKVVLSARDQATLSEAAAAMPGEALALPADVTDPETPAQLVDAAVERFGGLHVLVANAGGPPPGRALEVTDDELQAALNANLLASVRLVRAAIPHMRAAGWGRICLITSISVKQPIPTLALSNTARAGLWAWAKTAAADLAGDGITLNLACPGTHATERLRQTGGSGGGRVGDPADFGKVVCFLCSDPARFVSGAALQVDGAATLGLL
ncbi:MAG TPA: SDR family oxidoreductase [Actinomycetes bacterium]|nr:SDR family oxidoreductase [Actinomycetes bacterium]